MYFLASFSERGDANAISMVYVVFWIPIILMALLNAEFIYLISFLKNRNLKLLLSFLPLAIFTILSQFKDVTISIIDGDLVFVALTDTIAIGITNLLWAGATYLSK
jgi:hypothetical protein